MSITAAYTGTFDPITLGHTDLIRRAAKMYSRVIVAVAKSADKQPMFTLEQRVQMAIAALEDVPNVEVKGFEGLIVDFARENGVTVLVRGVRNVKDFDYERQMADMNRHLYESVDTVMLSPMPRHSHISSTLVREIARMGSDVRGLVPDGVAVALKSRFQE